MNREKKARWVSALRSGEYAQNRGHLAQEKDGNRSYCCLGVLCELALADGVEMEIRTTADGRVLYDNNDLVLPLAVQEWADLPYMNPDIRVGDLTHSLAELNDGISYKHVEPRNFAEIADVIEVQL